MVLRRRPKEISSTCEASLPGICDSSCDTQDGFQLEFSADLELMRLFLGIGKYADTKIPCFSGVATFAISRRSYFLDRAALNVSCMEAWAGERHWIELTAVVEVLDREAVVENFVRKSRLEVYLGIIDPLLILS